MAAQGGGGEGWGVTKRRTDRQTDPANMDMEEQIPKIIRIIIILVVVVYIQFYHPCTEAAAATEVATNTTVNGEEEEGEDCGALKFECI